MNSDELTAEDLITPLPFSYHYIAFLPSHFYSLLPLILLSSFPQHTMYLPLPNCLSTTVFHPLTSLSSLIFPQPFPCLYIRPSFSSLLAFFFSSTHTLPSIRLCACVCMCVLMLFVHEPLCACVHVFFLQGKMFITAEVRMMTIVIKIKKKSTERY